MTEKEAGFGDWLARRLRSEAHRARRGRVITGRPTGFGSGDPSSLLEGTAKFIETPSPLAPVAGKAWRGAKNILETTFRPGEARVFKETGEAISKIPRYPLILAGVGIPATLLGMQRASEDSDVLRRLTEAQAMGEMPMSEHTFNTFMQRRKHGSTMEKQAQGLKTVGRAVGSGLEPVGDLLKKLLYSTKDVTGDIASAARRHLDPQGLLPGMDLTPQQMSSAAEAFGDVTSRIGEGGKQIFERSEFDPWRAGGVAAGALGLGTAADILGEPIVGGAQAMLGYDQTNLGDEAALSFSREAGKQTAGMLGDLTRLVAGQAANMASAVPLTREQRRIFGHALKSDPLLSGATDHEIMMMEKAFSSMVRFAPQLATDEFAVRNYLRESLMSSSGGPDYGTLANLARASQTIEGR